MKAAFSNLTIQFPHTGVEEELVSICFISRAVNTGKFMVSPVNKKKLDVNGKEMQQWQTTALLGARRQRGF